MQIKVLAASTISQQVCLTEISASFRATELNTLQPNLKDAARSATNWSEIQNLNKRYRLTRNTLSLFLKCSVTQHSISYIWQTAFPTTIFLKRLQEFLKQHTLFSLLVGYIQQCFLKNTLRIVELSIVTGKNRDSRVHS